MNIYWRINNKINSQNCKPTNYQKDRLISETKKYIEEKLNDLHKEFECPNEFFMIL